MFRIIPTTNLIKSRIDSVGVNAWRFSGLICRAHESDPKRDIVQGEWLASMESVNPARHLNGEHDRRWVPVRLLELD